MENTPRNEQNSLRWVTFRSCPQAVTADSEYDILGHIYGSPKDCYSGVAKARSYITMDFQSPQGDWVLGFKRPPLDGSVVPEIFDNAKENPRRQSAVFTWVGHPASAPLASCVRAPCHASGSTATWTRTITRRARATSCAPEDARECDCVAARAAGKYKAANTGRVKRRIRESNALRMRPRLHFQTTFLCFCPRPSPRAPSNSPPNGATGASRNKDRKRARGGMRGQLESPCRRFNQST
ncbi:hypothetical protein B0H13DRAFT_1874855 [Mycena leptocephala]|nr:hypothetical protein B0H13DRAFT_1874855 [Mycena leptocephala]